MAFRAATSKIPVPQKGGRLLQHLRGLNVATPQPSLAMRFSQQMTFQLLGSAGLSRQYFDNDFLEGASATLLHLASDVLPAAMSADKSVSSRNSLEADTMEAALDQYFAEAIASLRDEGLELQWNIEEITGLSLGGLQLVYGMRRSRKSVPTEGSFRSEFSGHVVVLDGPKRHASARDAFESHRQGATLCADAIVTAKQTVMLRRTDSGEVLAGHFDEGANHKLRLEAELFGVEPPFGGIWLLQFDSERGWLASDLNSCLDGNCVAAALPEF
eukprot:TRINITY_DN25843_c0_g1_i1.p1 TRINITY_DN25843_c0_g1~~TRINITY_DN25843_c0_g1_i1.p1  ORF type:complete len:272 (-),score=39.69 TRINITY_DN25843_c0_g1_i1:71-886(-)